MRDLDRVGEVGRHDDVFVVRGPVAEVVADLHRLRHRVAEPREHAGDVLLVALRPVREVALPGEHLLADVPLDGEVVVWDRGADLRKIGPEGAFVGGEEVGPGRGRDEPVADRHRGREAHLEAHPRRQRPGAPHRHETGVGGDGLGRIARVELDRRRIDAGAEAEELPLADELAVPLVDPRLFLVGRDLHRGMFRDLGPLPVDPARPLAGLAVRDALQMRAEPPSDLGEGRVGVRIGQAADEVGAGERHGGDGLLARRRTGV